MCIFEQGDHRSRAFLMCQTEDYNCSGNGNSFIHSQTRSKHDTKTRSIQTSQQSTTHQAAVFCPSMDPCCKRVNKDARILFVILGTHVSTLPEHRSTSSLPAAVCENGRQGCACVYECACAYKSGLAMHLSKSGSETFILRSPDLAASAACSLSFVCVM